MLYQLHHQYSPTMSDERSYKSCHFIFLPNTSDTLSCNACLLFPNLYYQVDPATGALKTLAAKKSIGFIYTMNAPKEWGETAYGPMCYQIEGSLAAIYGCTVKSLKVFNTCLVKNYTDYDMEYFDAETKR